VLARVGMHHLTSGAAGATWRGNSARVTRTACNERIVRAARADCPCGAIGLLKEEWQERYERDESSEKRKNNKVQRRMSRC
jgi:hypothetical protein